VPLIKGVSRLRAASVLLRLLLHSESDNQTESTTFSLRLFDPVRELRRCHVALSAGRRLRWRRRRRTDTGTLSMM